MARQGQGPGSRTVNPAGGGPTRKHPAGGRGGNSGNGNSRDRDCCPMAAAVRSVKRGKFKLARRYAAWSIRLIAQRSRDAVARAWA